MVGRAKQGPWVRLPTLHMHGLGTPCVPGTAQVQRAELTRCRHGVLPQSLPWGPPLLDGRGTMGKPEVCAEDRGHGEGPPCYWMPQGGDVYVRRP